MAGSAPEVVGCRAEEEEACLVKSGGCSPPSPGLGGASARTDLAAFGRDLVATLDRLKRDACVLAVVSLALMLLGAVVMALCGGAWSSAQGFLAAALGICGLLGLVGFFPATQCHVFREEEQLKAMHKMVASDPGGLCYRMSLAGAVVADHRHSVLEQRALSKAWWQFPKVEFAMLFVFAVPLVIRPRRWISIICLGALSALGIVFARYIYLAQVRWSLTKSASQARANAIAFLCLPEASQVCVLYEGKLAVFTSMAAVPHDVRDLPMTSSRGVHTRIMARTQLLAHRLDDDEDSRVVGWSLRVLYGIPSRLKGREDWRVLAVCFPVDPAKVHDFWQWLTTEPRRCLFRFAGTAMTKADEIRADLPALFMPLGRWSRNEDSPLASCQQLLLTAHCVRDEADEQWLNISCMTIGGNPAAVRRMHATDTIADLCRDLAVAPDLARYRVALLLPDGRWLDQEDGMMALGQVFVG